MASWQRIRAIGYRQVSLMRGSPARILPLFAWITIDIVLWGFISRYLNSISAPGFNFVPALLGAVLLWDFLVRVMQGVSTAFLEDVWARNFLNIFASPLSIAEYVSGLVMCSIGTSAVGLVIMIALSGAIFGLSFFTYGILLIPFLLILFLSGIALGVLACGLVMRLGPAAEWFVWPIPALVSPFAGVFYPVATLPLWMQWISAILPPAYVFEGMRAIVAGHGVPPLALLRGLLLAVGYLLAACWYFTAIYHRAVRTGLIARYSAESAG